MKHMDDLHCLHFTLPYARTQSVETRLFHRGPIIFSAISWIRFSAALQAASVVKAGTPLTLAPNPSDMTTVLTTTSIHIRASLQR